MKILTAMGNPELNMKMQEYEEFEIISKDIQYKEGILEILEDKKEVDILILTNNILGELDFKELINKIIKIKNNLKIIVFLDKEDEKIEQYLNSKNIYKIYFLNKINFDLFIKDFFKNSQKNNFKIAQEIQEFKGLIYENKKIKENKKLNLKNCKTKIISITGNYNSGKTLFSYIFSNHISNKNYKVLIIDMNLENNDLDSILIRKVKKNLKNNLKILNFNFIIKKINNNLFCSINMKNELNKLNELEVYKIKEIFTKVNLDYDIILIDTQSNIKNLFIEKILKISDKIIFLSEENLFEVQKMEDNLEIISHDIKIKNDKIKVILNKTNEYKILDYDTKIIVRIPYNSLYTKLINNNFEKNDLEKLNSIYEKIYSNLFMKGE